jgi:UDP-glucose 4-epimerase
VSVLVTGGAGYIGSHVVLALLEAGEEVTVLDDFSTGFRSAVPDAARIAQGDVGDAALVKRVIEENGADAILHFAGAVDVAESVRDPLRHYLNNTCKSRILIECAIKAEVRHFIFSSSAAVYGSSECNPVTELSALKPISPYGSSKLMTETMLKDVAAMSNLRHVALRYFNVAGADPKGRVGQSTTRATHLIKAAVQTALGQRPYLELFGNDYDTPDGSCVRDYIHVHDLGPAHVAALAYLRRGGTSKILNCGYGRGYSVLEVVASVARVSRRDVPLVVASRRAGDPPALVADATKIRDLLGWHPEFDDLDEIVAHTINWERRLSARAAAEER